MKIWKFLHQYILPGIVLVAAFVAWSLDMVGRYQEIMGMPGWVWQASAGLLVFLAVFIFFYQVHNRLEAAPKPITNVQDAADVITDDRLAVYEPAPQALIDFALDYVCPTYEALVQIQQALIARECRNDIIRAFAISGIKANSEISTFSYGMDGIDRFGFSPPEPVTKSEIVTYVHALETGYQAVVQQANLLAIAAGGINLARHPDFIALYERWRQAHNAMVMAYEPIKRNHAFGDLFRPARPSRWGDLIGSTEVPHLHIIFDPSNNGRKFWSVEHAKDEQGNPTAQSYWEYRALIKNISNKTIRNVRVTVEAIGAMPTRPEPSHFDINKQSKIDLNPGEAHFAVIRRLWNPIAQPGVVLGPGAYGPIKLTVSADDISATSKLFQVDLDKNPAIYEMSETSG